MVNEVQKDMIKLSKFEAKKQESRTVLPKRIKQRYEAGSGCCQRGAVEEYECEEGEVCLREKVRRCL